MEIVLYSFMGILAGIDIAKRELPGWLFWGYGMAGAIGRVVYLMQKNSGFEGIRDWAASAAVGVCLLLISHAVDGAVGEGDGWYFVVTGFFVPWNVNLGLLCYGLLLCCVYAIGIIIWGVIKGVSVRGKRIPFLPFAALAGALMRAGQMWSI